MTAPTQDEQQQQQQAAITSALYQSVAPVNVAANDVYGQALAFRDELLAMQDDATSDLIDGYVASWQAIKAEMDGLLGEYASAQDAAKESGVPVPPSWLFEANRMQAVLDTLQAAISDFMSRSAAPSITA